jgi:hypothetical protein
MGWVFNGEPRPYRGKLIQCKSDHYDYVCSHDEVVVSGRDGTGPNTRLPIAGRAWVSEVTSCPVWH